eukprot:9473749-Karenia_brevis.AAC.1
MARLRATRPCGMKPAPFSMEPGRKREAIVEGACDPAPSGPVWGFSGALWNSLLLSGTFWGSLGFSGAFLGPLWGLSGALWVGLSGSIWGLSGALWGVSSRLPSLPHFR